jgi:hypothetical protein
MNKKNTLHPTMKLDHDPEPERRWAYSEDFTRKALS